MYILVYKKIAQAAGKWCPTLGSVTSKLFFHSFIFPDFLTLLQYEKKKKTH